MKELKKLIVGISLLVQSVTMFVLFLSQRKERKGLSVVFLGISAASGVLGAKLISDCADAEDEEEEEDLCDIELNESEIEDIDLNRELEISEDMVKADLEHGTVDEAQSRE
jgi:hypothetical protein